ncbi:MAG: TIR domain-containing protein [Congregibacter sp.]
MVDYLYKAYLSYSHADAAWARWLHRSLESYRVPSALAGVRPDGRVVPARVSPIFRDREDLSSTADLGEGLEQALRDSEFLILICSPNAAQSRWVNEEVRYFQSLGRADRVFCVLVEGDAEIRTGPDSCFPPALIDGMDDALAEPLAVDPRRFADGKELARLKLIAGLLGVRLDDLRRRDLKRRRRWQALIVSAVIGVGVLALLAVSARQAEQRERQSAEQMASFIVDLGEELKSEIGLEALGLISSRAMAYLEDINPSQLSAETGVKVGLALRQIGQVSDGQGRADDARKAFLRSRDLFGDLHHSYPGQQELLFELGQAEFYVSDHYLVSGQNDLALPSAKRYAEISQQLYEADPENPKWQLELSYAATGLLAVEVMGGGPYSEKILTQADRALSLAQTIINARPEDSEAIANLYSTLAWAADTRRLACELEQALSERQETLMMAEKALEKAPADNFSRVSLAYAHSGVAVVEAQLGELDEARTHWRTAIEAIRTLWREDPSNERLKNELQWRRIYLVRAQLDDGENDAAAAELDRVLADTSGVDSPSDSGIDSNLKLEYLIARARIAFQRDSLPAVQDALASALRLYAPLDSANLTENQWAYLAEIQYLWWRAFESLPAKSPSIDIQLGEGLRTCRAAISNARIALIQGRSDSVISELDYLESRGYRGRDAQEICEALPSQVCVR